MSMHMYKLSEVFLYAFCAWAFDVDATEYEHAYINQDLMLKWNDKHGDKYLVNGDEAIIDSLCKMKDLYDKYHRLKRDPLQRERFYEITDELLSIYDKWPDNHKARNVVIGMDDASHGNIMILFKGDEEDATNVYAMIHEYARAQAKVKP